MARAGVAPGSRPGILTGQMPPHGQRKGADVGGGGNAREAARFLEHVSVEAGAIGGLFVLGNGERGAQGEHAGGAEAGIDILQAPESANQQPGGNQQDHGGGDFGDDQRRAQALLAAADAAARAFAQTGEIAAAGAQGGQYAEGQARSGP